MYIVFRFPDIFTQSDTSTNGKSEIGTGRSPWGLPWLQSSYRPVESDRSRHSEGRNDSESPNFFCSTGKLCPHWKGVSPYHEQPSRWVGNPSTDLVSDWWRTDDIDGDSETWTGRRGWKGSGEEDGLQPSPLSGGGDGIKDDRRYVATTGAEDGWTDS